jgi:hypothetical protein
VLVQGNRRTSACLIQLDFDVEISHSTVPFVVSFMFTIMGVVSSCCIPVEPRLGRKQMKLVMPPDVAINAYSFPLILERNRSKILNVEYESGNESVDRLDDDS